jgi:glycerol uptake facilitator-like aquaporin
MLLLTTIVGSGIMGDKLTASNNPSVALLANSLATGCVLYALILTFSEISGSHFNPIISILAAWDRSLSRRFALVFVLAQLIGAVCGVVLANSMFGFAYVSESDKIRSGVGQYLAEAVATFGLVIVVRGCSRFSPPIVASAVAAYIAAAFWFTASTCFANPAVTVARMLTNSIAGIRPSDAIAFVVAQLLGAVIAYMLSERLFRHRE